MTAKKKTQPSYTAKDIKVLSGLDPVRKRPAMYIGSTGPEGVHHLLKELVGNSIDESIMGYCDLIEVVLLPDQKVRVKDNGRGFPVDKHPQTKKSAVETIFTHLHSGAKFGSKAYATSGGLHGIGVAAVSALSENLEVKIARDGYIYTQQYSRGKPITGLKKGIKVVGTGSTITFKPDPKIFEQVDWQWKKILKMLRQQAFLTPGVKIVLSDERSSDEKKHRIYAFFFEGGIVSYVRYLTRGRPARHSNIFYVKEKKEDVIVEVAFCYTEEFESFEEGFANNIFTPEGGSHISGFRSSITRTLNNYAQEHSIIKKNEEPLTGKDTRQGITAIISVKVKEPQFEGQTKKKLGNTEAGGIVRSVVSDALSSFLERHSEDAHQIIESCIRARKARKAAQKARDTVMQKGISRFLALPGKLADCSSNNPAEKELYILEGPSAGGSAKQGRDRRFQAILPLRGKVLNAEKAKINRVLASDELRALTIALGTSIGDEFDLEKLRYHRIIIMADADVDGMHIRCLLLTVLFRYFRPLIDAGYVYIAQPPLFQIKQGKRVEYVFSEEEREKVMKEMEQDKSPIATQRYKGLGEMNPEQLWETTMDPQNRILWRVEVDDAEEADRTFDILMGAQVGPRKKFIRVHARGVENLDV